MSSTERANWGMTNDNYACYNDANSLIEFVQPSLGRIGLNKIPPARTYNLPPHYGLGVKNII